MIKYLKKLFVLMMGLSMMGVGVAMSYQAYIGLPPWDVFHDGISKVVGLEIGKVNIIVGMLILVVVVACREKIGFATFINILTVGSVCDLVVAFNIIPSFRMYEGYEFFVPRAAMCVGSLLFLSLGMYFYMSVQLGAGPRDTLMVMLTRRTKMRVGAVRLAVEGSVFVAGWLLGGKIGVGSVIQVLLGGPVMEIIFRLFKFDVTKLRNSTMAETIADIRGIAKARRGAQ